MSNASGSSCSSTNGRHRGRLVGVPKRCWCGEGMSELISRSDQNPFRRYYRCNLAATKKLVNDNHIFKWVDEAHLNEIEKLQMANARVVQELEQINRNDAELEKAVFEKVESKLVKEMTEMVEEKIAESEVKMKKMLILIVFVGVVTIGIIKAIA